MIFDKYNYKDAIHHICHAFDLGEPKNILLLGGTATIKFAIEAKQCRFVIKVRPAEFAKENIVAFDHQVLQRLHEAKLPVPYPEKNKNGKTWMFIDDKMIEVLSWVDGGPFQWEKQKLLENLAVFVARFHSVLNGNIPPGKENILREDHPDLMQPHVTELKTICKKQLQQEQLDGICELINLVREKLDKSLYDKLPKSLIHGDLHQGNIKFGHLKVSAVYDFDYLSLQARMRDIADLIIFFAAKRSQPFMENDIVSVTQTFECDYKRTLIVLKGYHEINALEKKEIQALPLLILSRWIQMRLRGSRKVPEEQKLPFVLNRFFDVPNWLTNEWAQFLEKLNDELIIY